MSTGKTSFGSYTLLYPLGMGGMGEVFLARQEGEHGIHRLVALKRMLGAVNREERLVTLFLDEVRIASQLTHGNLVQVIDHGKVGGQHFMAMEYVHGENLQSVLARLSDRGERLATDLLLHLACAVCQGLDYAHSKHGMGGAPLNIVHRDISPQNILLSFQGQVKIADFGIARAAERTHETLGGELKGKLAYMSPEQAQAKALDHRSDIYSLGLVLYEALAGKNPLRREKSLATLDAVRAPCIPPLADVRPDLPHELVEQIHWALSPELEDRPETARAFYEALQQTVRFYNLVVTPFDLADLMLDLFPTARAAEAHEGGVAPEATEVGRRADENLELLEQDTVCYLKTRHGDSAAELLAGESPEPDPPRDSTATILQQRRLWPFGLVALAAAMALVAALVPSDDDPPGRPAPAADASMPGPDLRSRADAAPPDMATPDRPRARPHRDRHRAKPPRPAPPPATPIMAQLTVTSSHPCKLSLNGAPLGLTPIQAQPHPPGPVTLTCRDAAAGIREQRRLTLKAGQPARVTFRFGVLTVNLNPWASVTVDGRDRGTTPLRLVLAEGEHRVILRNQDRDLSRNLSVEVSAIKAARISSW
jgi:hypothetical protein